MCLSVFCPIQNCTDDERICAIRNVVVAQSVASNNWQRVKCISNFIPIILICFIVDENNGHTDYNTSFVAWLHICALFARWNFECRMADCIWETLSQSFNSTLCGTRSRRWADVEFWIWWNRISFKQQHMLWNLMFCDWWIQDRNSIDGGLHEF